MPEFADYANDEQAQSLEDLLAYESGQISFEEAIDRGVVDETTGELPNITTWGVHDIHSLVHELDKCDLYFAPNRQPRKIEPEHYWRSGNKLYRPKEMTTAHLRNAINYAKKEGIDGPIVAMMQNEFKKRHDE